MEEKKYLKRKNYADKQGSKEELAIACQRLGDFYNEQGRHEEAVTEYLMVANVYALIGKELETAKAHRMVGEMYILLSDFENGKDHIAKYLKIASRIKNKVEEQRAYTTLGRAHLLHGQTLTDIPNRDTIVQLKEAEKAFVKSLLLTKDLTGQISKLEQLDMQARCYLNLGVVKEQMEEVDEAVAYMEKALKISKTNDIFELSHLCYVSMSLMYHAKRNDTTLALQYCNLALDVAKRFTQKVQKLCETLIIKSEILIKAGDFASAKQILTKAYKKNTPAENDRITIERSLRIVVKICQLLDELITTSSIDYSKRKGLYEKLGDGCCNLGNYMKALEYYHKTLECAQLNKESPKAMIPIYVSLYQTYKDNKQYDQALEFLWKEYELNKDVPNEAFATLCSIAEIYEMQKLPFWTIQDIYHKAKDHVAKADHDKIKLERIVYGRLRKLQLKNNMCIPAEELLIEAKSKGIDLNSLHDESDSEIDGLTVNENNTPELGEDICLEDLTDSDTSDLDETERPRLQRATRGVRSLTIKRNNKGETQLHQACIAGNTELVRRLIDQGHILNVRDHAGWLPLHEASIHGYRDIVQLLLDRGAAVAINDKGGTSCDGITPLYDACSNGYLDVVELLLERGADATVKTDFGDTCLSALDKWRNSTTLIYGEQVQYEQIRTKLITTLSKVGICSTQVTKPLTNSSAMYKDPFKEKTLTDTIHMDNIEKELHKNERSSTSRVNYSKPKAKTSSPTSASFEYKNAIEQLKHPNHRKPINESGDNLYCPIESGNNKRSAYVDADEIDDEFWLIDDLRHKKKKRRYQISPSINSRLSKPDTEISLSSRDLSPESDVHDVLLDKVASTSQSAKLTLSHSSSFTNHTSIASATQRQTHKYQSSLLERGFCRFRSKSPQFVGGDLNKVQTTVTMRTTEPDSTTTSSQLLISPRKSSHIKDHTTPPTLPATVSFKVKVEDELMVVPIDKKKLSDINMRWLAEEASRRYYNLVGLKPVLRLKTTDGFAYAENDLVNVALEQTMVLATVIEWQILPLRQRYEEMCTQLQKIVNTDVQDVLQRAQISHSISLKNMWLTPLETEPIFKSILHHTNLRILDLSNNFIQNDGCRQLAKSISTLKQLKTINLKSNFITSDGLEVLLVCYGIEKMPEIEELILSKNPLGNISLRTLDQFCNSSSGKFLQKLHLSQCQITHLYDYDLAFCRLLDFDISFNQLNDDSIRKILQKLNSSRLENLNLSYIKNSLSGEDRKNFFLAERLADFFQSGTCEKFKTIKLVGCQLGDVNIYKIVQCLNRAPEFELFNISDNNRLSSSSLHFIIDKLPKLRQLITVNCINLIDVEQMDHLTKAKNIPNYMSVTLTSNITRAKEYLIKMWRMHWGNRGMIMTLGTNFILYTNDKDLSCIK